MKRRIQGSIESVVIICLVLALATALGWVYYLNVINRKPVTNSTDVVIVQKPKSKPAPKQDSTQQKEYINKKYGIRFSYPGTWKVTDSESPTMDNMLGVVVENEQNKVVAELGTNPQLGGACTEDSPLLKVITLVDNPVNATGLKASHFGYMIYEDGYGVYQVMYGLNNGSAKLGERTVQCPGLGEKYRYVVESAEANKKVIGVVFGAWNVKSNITFATSFKSLDEAKAYAESEDMKKVEAMISSFSLNQ